MDDNTRICTNEIHATPTPALFRYLKGHGVSLADAAAQDRLLPMHTLRRDLQLYKKYRKNSTYRKI